LNWAPYQLSISSLRFTFIDVIFVTIYCTYSVADTFGFGFGLSPIKQ
jgi:hypothetical protein